MRRFSGLNIKYAYPGTLGQYVPTPPPGFVFLVTLKQPGEAPYPNVPDFSGYDEFDYLTDDNGSLLIVEAT